MLNISIFCTKCIFTFSHYLVYMPYGFRKKSCVPAYQNHVPCGNLKCKVSCASNYLFCAVCCKPFHYKCAGLTKKAYLDHVRTNKNFICSSNSCSRSLFPFNNLDHIDCVTTQIDRNLPPCKKCKRGCLFAIKKQTKSDELP